MVKLNIQTGIYKKALLTCQALYTKMKLFLDIQFPGTIPDDYDEPNGLDFLQYKEWQRINEETSKDK
jgi:hypothetical protein